MRSGNASLVEGIPKLAVEVLSPPDRTEEIREKVLAYLAAGVELVWGVAPYFRTVAVHQPGSQPEMFNNKETLTGGTTLPGLEIPVTELFR